MTKPIEETFAEKLRHLDALLDELGKETVNDLSLRPIYSELVDVIDFFLTHAIGKMTRQRLEMPDQ